MIILFIFQFQIATNLIKHSVQSRFFSVLLFFVCSQRELVSAVCKTGTSAVQMIWKFLNQRMAAAFTFIVRHAHVRILQLALVHAVIHVHVGCTRGKDFWTNFFYHSFLVLLVDVVNLSQALELQERERKLAHVTKFPAENNLIKNSSLSTEKRRPET